MESTKADDHFHTKAIWPIAFLTILALNVNFTLSKNSENFMSVLNTFKNYHFFNLILFFMLAFFYKKAICTYNTYFKRSERKYICFPAVLFSLFMIVGVSFYLDNSWQLVWGGVFKIIRAFIVFSGYFFLFSSVITLIFYSLDQKIKKKNSPFTFSAKAAIQNSWLVCYISLLRQRPFFTAFITFFIAYIPYIILSYPGIFMGDTPYQINLISENITLNNHHPILHSLLIHLFVIIGKVCFNSYNIGIFLYCIFQFLIVLTALSSLIKIYVKNNTNTYIIIFTMLYFVFSPRIQSYMFTITKDVLFAAFLLFFILTLQNSQKEFMKNIGLVISSVCIILLRNDGKYMILLSALIIGILNRSSRRQMMLIAAGTICISVFYGKVALPYFQITPGSRREMMSIPFQQTARYLRDAGIDVTSEEKKTIEQILDYEHLPELYDPNISDPVKATFNEQASSDDLKRYFRCWVQMFLKHPGIYLQATINNKYLFFYPVSLPSGIYSYSWSIDCMEKTNELTKDTIHTDFSYPNELNIFRNTYEQLRETIFGFPVISILLSSAAYIWLLILWTCYCMKKKSVESILYIIPLYIQLLICIAGPCNGNYFRYLYPIAFCLPSVLTLGFKDLKTDFEKI